MSVSLTHLVCWRNEQPQRLRPGTEEAELAKYVMATEFYALAAADDPTTSAGYDMGARGLSLSWLRCCLFVVRFGCVLSLRCVCRKVDLGMTRTSSLLKRLFVACGAGYDGCLRGMSLAEATRDMRKYSGALVFNYDVEGLTDMVSTSRVLLLVTAPHQLESTRLMGSS